MNQAVINRYIIIMIIINSPESADVEDHQNQCRNEGDAHRTAY